MHWDHYNEIFTNDLKSAGDDCVDLQGPLEMTRISARAFAAALRAVKNNSFHVNRSLVIKTNITLLNFGIIMVTWAFWRLKLRQPHRCSNSLFKLTRKQTSKLRVTGSLRGDRWPEDSPHKRTVMRIVFPCPFCYTAECRYNAVQYTKILHK